MHAHTLTPQKSVRRCVELELRLTACVGVGFISIAEEVLHFPRYAHTFFSLVTTTSLFEKHCKETNRTHYND